VAQHGQGWYGFQLTPEVLKERLGVLDAALSAAGRKREDIEVAIGARGRPGPDDLREFRELGVDQIIVPVFATDAEGYLRRLDKLAEQTAAI